MKAKFFLFFVVIFGCSYPEINIPLTPNETALDLEYSLNYESSPEHAEQIHFLMKNVFGYSAKIVNLPDRKESIKSRAGGPCWLNNLGFAPVSVERVDEGNGTWCYAYQWSNDFTHLSCWNSSGHIGYRCYE